MTSRLTKQLIIIVLSLGVTFVIIFTMQNRIDKQDMPSEQKNGVTQQEISSTIAQREGVKTAVEALVISNSGSELQLELQLLQENKVVTVSNRTDLVIVKQVFSAAGLQETPMNFEQIKTGMEVSITVFTGEVDLASQSSIDPIEILVRG